MAVIFCLNSGSSSLKFSFYEIAGDIEQRPIYGAVEGIGLEKGKLWIKRDTGEDMATVHGTFADFSSAVDGLASAAKDLGFPQPSAIGHRLVHGGPNYWRATRVTDSLLGGLRRSIAFAPLHIPNALQVFRAITDRFPETPQVACFDTAFHRLLPDVAQRLPLPRHMWDEGIRRYGFHGLSFEYIMTALGQTARSRVLIAHLGSGASLAAVLKGQPLDTSMGFTPAGGMMMGTRSGDLDPGVLIHLLNEKAYDSRQLDSMVNNYSGLLGVSGITSDMKTLLELRSHDPRAAQAVELYCYQLRKNIGAMAAVLGGVDTLVFTGGIGEHAAAIRWEVCQGLGFLQIHLDAEQNKANADVISAPRSSCTVRVIATNEDLMIARHTNALLFAEAKCA